MFIIAIALEQVPDYRKQHYYNVVALTYCRSPLSDAFIHSRNDGTTRGAPEWKLLSKTAQMNLIPGKALSIC